MRTTFAETAASLRRRPLFEPSPSHAVDHGPGAVERLIPHRPPMRLVDRIHHVDLDEAAFAGTFTPQAADPVFRGHFPGAPVYPGVLLIEAMGQLGLCGLALVDHGGRLPDDESVLDVRMVRLHHAEFRAPAGPGDELTLLARGLENDGLTATIAGQVFRGSTLCAASICEVYFV